MKFNISYEEYSENKMISHLPEIYFEIQFSFFCWIKKDIQLNLTTAIKKEE